MDRVPARAGASGAADAAGVVLPLHLAQLGAVGAARRILAGEVGEALGDDGEGVDVLPSATSLGET